MKVVCVGCSFTNGHTGSRAPYGSYPHIIKENVKGSIVYNLGIGGGSNIMSNMILESAINQIKPDFVVRQITLKERFAVTKKEKNIDLLDMLSPYGNDYFLINENKIRNIFAYWSSRKTYHTGTDYTPTELAKTQKFFYNMFTDTMIDELHDSIISKTEKMLSSIPHVVFSWRELDTLGKYPSVETTIGFEKENLSDFDGHFNIAGNTKLFEKIIKPEIEKYV